MQNPGSPTTPPAASAADPDPIEPLQRKIRDYDRWFQFLDGQMRVLERERQKLAAVVNHSDAGFFVLDSNLKVTWANNLLSKLSGMGTGDTSLPIGERCHRVLCHEDSVCSRCPAARAFETGEVAHLELDFPAEERERHIYATAMPIRAPEGEVEETIVMLQDVSDLQVLRQSQEALRTSEERFRSIFEHAAEGMVLMLPDGELLEANSAFCHLFGYSVEALRSKNLLELVHSGDHVGLGNSMFEIASGSRNSTEFGGRFSRKDATTLRAHLTVTGFHGGEGRITHCLAVVQDDRSEQ